MSKAFEHVILRRPLQKNGELSAGPEEKNLPAQSQQQKLPPRERRF